MDSRLKALKSSIVKELSIGIGPLQNKISVGEDTAELAFKPFYTALSNCGLLPKAKGNDYLEETKEAALYNTNSHDHDKVMRQCKKDVVYYINLSYEYLEEHYEDFLRNQKFIMSNRGTYAYVMIIGSLHSFIFKQGYIDKDTNMQDRFNLIEKYIQVLIQGLIDLSKEEKEYYLIMKGAGADIAWYRLFQTVINKKFSEYEPQDLIDWKERQDKKLQAQAREYIEYIEKTIKEYVLKNMQIEFKDNWELEINSFKRKCLERVEAEKEKQYKEGMPIKDRDWTEMLTIMDYKSIIEKYWSRKNESDDFVPFEKIFSIDIGEDFKSKSDQLKWLSYLNNYRNTIAHAGSKESGLNYKEVLFLENIYNHFYK